MAEDHFSKLAGAYARGRFGYPPALLDELARLSPQRDLAWDCGTGTGQVVPELASRFRRVVATDISADLLARAPVLGNVTYHVAPAESTPILDAAVDLCTVAQALHWFELPAFWTEVRRVLKPHGILACWGYTWPKVDAEIDARMVEFRAQIHPFWPERSVILHNEYRDIEAPFERIFLRPFSASAQWTKADYLAHIESWSAIRYYRERVGSDPLSNFAAVLSDLWSDRERRVIEWPLHLQVWRR